MNQNFYNSNSSGFDQSQPPQFPVIHQPPQETNIKILHDQENAVNSDALGNKQYKPKDIQELLRELFNDVQNIHEELAEYINTPGWNCPAFCNNGDDDEEDCTIPVTPDFPITDSLIMENEHLNTILETESDEFIKSSVENLVLIPNIRLIEILLYDNSSPCPPEEFVSENSNADIESFFPSPIPNEDSDSHSYQRILSSKSLLPQLQLGIKYPNLID
nr:hypothetical protein [Tanacetum cinerariifolium]